MVWYIHCSMPPQLLFLRPHHMQGGGGGDPAPCVVEADKGIGQVFMSARAGHCSSGGGGGGSGGGNGGGIQSCVRERERERGPRRGSIAVDGKGLLTRHPYKSSPSSARRSKTRWSEACYCVALKKGEIDRRAIEGRGDHFF